MADNIIIDFQVNDAELQSAVDRLATLGKVDAGAAAQFKKTNTEFTKRSAALKDIIDGSQKAALNASKEQAVYNKLVASLKTLSGESKKTVENLLKLSPQEISEGFAQAAVSVDDFTKVMESASGSAEDFEAKTNTLKQELKQLTAQLTLMKLNGEDNTEVYKQLAQRAGELTDAFADTRAEIKDFASDTKTIDNVLGSVTALAGGFAAAQGAMALFGDENKDLQETLVKVSAAMAVLQGVQGLQNALQKEGAISLLALNIQERVAIVQKKLLVAAQSEYVIVSGAATVATRVLNAVMAANPIGLFIAALVAVVGAFAFFISRAHDAAVAVGELNNAVYNGTSGLDAYAEGSKRALDKITSDLEKAGARQSDLQAAQGKATADLINKRKAEIENLNKTIVATENSTNKDVVEARGKALEAVAKLEQDNADAVTELHKQQNDYDKQLRKEALEDQLNAQKIVLANAKEGSRQQLEAQKAIIQAQASLDTNEAGQDAIKVAAIQAQAAKDRLETEVAFQRRIADLRAQDIDVQIQQAKNRDATNRDLYILELKRIQATADAEILNTKLSENEKAEIRKKANADRAAATKAFNEADRAAGIQAEIDKNAAILAQRDVSNSEALQATVDNITYTAQLEIDATKNNAAKVAAIIADRDAKIRQARLSSIQKELQDELALRTASNGPEVRAIALQQQMLDESFAKRRISLQGYYNYSVELIQAQAKIDLDNNQLSLDALNASLKAKAISEKDYNIQYAQLSDERAAIYDAEQEKIRQASKKTKDQQKADTLELIDYTIQTIGTLGNLISDALQSGIDAQNVRIENQKNKIQELQEQGRISDKEATARLRQLAAEEAKIKRQQAQKDKEAAIFNAVINTAQAVVKAYSTVGPLGGPVFAAIAAAIGAAQIAIIASRPIPQFSRGKKPGLYEGFGEVAEHGPEAIQRADGTMYVQKDRGLVWLGKNDQVFTAKETASMVNTPVMRSNTVAAIGSNTGLKLDYDKLSKMIGKEVGSNTKSTVVIDGIEAMIIEGLQTTNMLNARRRYNK